MNAQTINKLLTALNECTEWGQVFILDSLANYSPKDDREAQSICERITPRLAHANAAVVLSAIKVNANKWWVQENNMISPILYNLFKKFYILNFNISTKI
jgi:vesicle coat complex subunit